jgi:hypothetical protein
MRIDELFGLLPRLKFNPSPDFPLWALEFLFWAVVLLVTALLWRFKPHFTVFLEWRLRRIGRRRTACVLAIIAAAIVLRLALVPAIPIPLPIVHDEYSYLLGADTFASGRLTNPPHPMWQHFEGFHINVIPTYQSMYPPAQALVLAAGQRAFGHPWYGVLISVAVMCGTICWMLQGWMPGHWALLGGIFSVLRYGVFSYWVNSYWGGAVAATGGALLLGAFVRIKRRPSVPNALLLALGLAILANSRPLEGLLFSIPAVGALLWWIMRTRRAGRGLMLRVVWPVALVMTVMIAALMYYNWRSTGHPFLAPYQVNHGLYHFSKPFLWQKALPVHNYRHQEVRAFYMYHEMPDYLESRYWWGVKKLSIRKANVYYVFFLWPFLVLTVLSLWRAFTRDKQLRVVAMAVLSVTCGLFAQVWPPQPHYAAPVTGAVMLLVLSFLRDLRAWNPSTNLTQRKVLLGRTVSRAAVVVLLFWMASPIAAEVLDPYHLFKSYSVPMYIEHARLGSELQAMEGKHVVIVHYPRTDVPGQDWIYNKADIDSSKIVWARDMGYGRNQELLRYYPDRHFWYVDRGDPVHRLVPYGSTARQEWRGDVSH